MRRHHSDKSDHTATIVFTGGGSGGHVLPAFGIIDELDSNIRVLWLGSRKGIEARIVTERGIKFIGINTGKLRRYVSLRNIVDFFRFLSGIIQSLYLFIHLRPQLVFSKGGFVTVGPVIAAGLLRIPVVSHESDYDPGLATRINLNFTSLHCIAYEVSRSFYPSRTTVVVTGNPLRQDIFGGNRERGLCNLGLSSDLPVLLVQGGSLGARQINDFIALNALELLEHVNIIHQTGNQGLSPASNEALYESSGRLRNFSALPSHLRARYVARDFFRQDYSDILAASDIVLSRSGAGSLWEIGVLAKPAIFIPLIKGSRGDQLHNARYAERVGSAIVCSSEADLATLPQTIINLVADPLRQKAMATAWTAIVHKEGAIRIARLLINYFHHGVLEDVIGRECEST